LGYRGVKRLEPGRGSIVAELPFTVETWISSSDEDRIDVLVNRTPVTGDVDVERWRKKDHIAKCKHVYRCNDFQ
jgi:hypothetical protein